jgi:hypothetical protein
MLIFIAIGLAIFAIVPAIWWAYFRYTKAVIPGPLSDVVESEEFRSWLGQCRYWLVFGRKRDGHYQIIACGWLGARAIMRKAKQMQRC